ncbi:MAG: PIG-L family deacetylase [Lentimicrobiaceae bacterium]|nr:PIG-L family deacetylase [Lentimicrobiaceae bacterium]
MKNNKTILIVAAHPDDEVLGCGASIAKWSNAGESVHVLIMSEGATSRGSVRDVNMNSTELSLLSKSANLAGKILGTSSVKLLGLPDNRMDSLDRLDIIKLVEKEVDRLKPHTVVTHHGGDLNIDHRIIYESVITACRPQPGHVVKRLLTFEVVSSTEWQPSGSNSVFRPNWFEDVSITIDRKIEALKEYEMEMRQWPHARSLQNIEYLAKYRGASVGCAAAEAFMLIREIIH